MRLKWRVEGYRDASGAVVDRECEALIAQADVRDGAAELVGWLKAVQAGDLSPARDADAAVVSGRLLKYRPAGGVVLIFGLSERRPPEPMSWMIALRFSRWASALPTVADLRTAGDRWDIWRAGHEG